MQITMTRDALLKTLRERLAAATAEDERIAKLHQADEQKALKEFRARLKEAMTWTWDRAKKLGRYGDESLSPKAPACPNRNAPSIGGVLRLIEMSTSKTFAIKSDSDIHRAVTWLPERDRLGKTVCD